MMSPATRRPAKRPIARSTRRSPRHSFQRERCWTLVGERQGRIWHARRVQPRTGDAASVEFDGPWALAREERRGDVVGFFHTHPAGLPRPSQRDQRTMRAWTSSFGKPLLCVIQSPAGLAAYRFDHDDAHGEPVLLVESFPRGVLVAVEAG
jgi:proteasome lid subunit RPN8/RPN11